MAKGKKIVAAPPQNAFSATIAPAVKFAKESYMLVKFCTKPDAKEFKEIATATTIGFVVMGFIGYFVKLVHIPIKYEITVTITFSKYKSITEIRGIRGSPSILVIIE